MYNVFWIVDSFHVQVVINGETWQIQLLLCVVRCYITSCLGRHGRLAVCVQISNVIHDVRYLMCFSADPICGLAHTLRLVPPTGGLDGGGAGGGVAGHQRHVPPTGLPAGGELRLRHQDPSRSGAHFY